MQDTLQTAHRPDADSVLQDIADYVVGYEIRSPRAYAMAAECLVDALAGCFLALQDRDCRRYLGPVVPGATLAHGARVPGTSLELDPVMAAFNIGALLGAREHHRVAHPDGDAAPAGGHPDDTLGAILAVADYRSRQAHNDGAEPLRVREVLTAMIKAHEIQRVIAESNGFSLGALDPVILVRVAVAAVATQMQAGNRAQVLAAVSHAWLDGGSLRRAAQPDGRDGRRVWAAADAGGRGVRLSLLALAGEPGYAGTLSAPRWGFYDALFDGRAFRFDRAYGSHCMDHPTFATRGPDAFAAAVTGHFPAKQADRILARFADRTTLAGLAVNEMLATMVKNS